MEIILNQITTIHGILFIGIVFVLVLSCWWVIHMFYFIGRKDIEYLTPQRKKYYHDEFLKKLNINNNQNKEMNTKEFILYLFRCLGYSILVGIVVVVYVAIALFLALGFTKYYLWIPLSIGLAGLIFYMIRKKVLKKKQLSKIHVY